MFDAAGFLGEFAGGRFGGVEWVLRVGCYVSDGFVFTGKAHQFVVEAQRNGAGHVGARAESGKSDLVQVDAELFCVLVYPHDSVHAIFHSGREWHLWRKTVVDSDHDSIALVNHRTAPPGVVHRRTKRESSTVEVKHNRIAAPTLPTAASPQVRTQRSNAARLLFALVHTFIIV